MKERREKRKRWVRRGQYAVEVEVDVVYPPEIRPKRVWSRPRCDGLTRSPVVPRKAMSPTSSPSATYFEQFPCKQNEYRRWDLNPHGCYPTGF